mgnify:CR=1 FL=1
MGLLYAAYAWAILLFAATPVALVCLFVPGLKRRRAVARWGARALLKLIGSDIRILGTPLDERDVAVVVSNHQSYLDGIILTAALPPNYTFLIKREMVRVPIAGFVLARLGSQFVDRTDATQRNRSARRLVATARKGRALVVFPEGTFDGEPGLKPFRLGAFRAARIAGVAVAPVVISGARQKLPADSWLPRPGPLTVEYCGTLDSSNYADEIELMRAARRSILERLDEPDLDDPGPIEAASAAAAPVPGSGKPVTGNR